jgi:rod shape determining protein RodA
MKYKLFSALTVIAFLLSTYVGYQYEFLSWVIAFFGVFVLILIHYNSRSFFGKGQLGMMSIIVMLTVFSFAISHAFENILKPHQQDRINVWLNPGESDPRGSLYNIMQAKMAIGSGGLSGKGFLNGTMTKLNYVPEQNTDFIFTTIGEEQGFVGCVGVLFLFFVLLFRILNNGERSKNQFPMYFSYGVAGVMFIHIFINIGMTIGVAPVIGIPLPFISKGGSSLLSFSILIGILLNMSKQVK